MALRSNASTTSLMNDARSPSGNHSRMSGGNNNRWSCEYGRKRWLMSHTLLARAPLTEHFQSDRLLAQKHRLPTMFGSRDNVAAGGLMSYAPVFDDLWRRAAVYIDKILKGAKPAELPIDQASKYQLVINRKTARVLGLTIPPSMLARADEILE